MKKELDLNQKTIYHKFPTWEEFHQEAINCIEKIMANNEDENLFGFYSYCVYDKWKLNIYYNQPEVFFSKLWSGMASKFFLFKKRERLWNNIFEHLKLEMSKLIDIRTTEYTRDDRTKYLDANKSQMGDFDRTITGNTLERGENREAQRITNSEKPYNTIDLLHSDYGHIADRADWLSTEAKIDSGYIGIERDKDGKVVLGDDGKPNKVINPNWNKKVGRSSNKDYSHKQDKTREDSKETDHGTIDKTITTQEQPVFYQQLARIMPSFSLVETNMEDLTDFSELFHSFYLPQGEFRWNTNTWQYDYITRQQLIEEQEPEKKKQREKPQKDPEADLSEDEWKELWTEKTKPCMPTWYLEQIYRNKKRIEKKPNPDETDQARLELCETLLDTFYRAPYVPPVSVFEAVMGSPDYDWAQYVVDKDNLKESRKFKKDNNIQIGDVLPTEVIGFKEFKSQMWENLKVFHRERSLGIIPFQVFPYLLGPPGTGKSEITRWLAVAFKRPIQIINVGGMDDGGELEGKRATLQSANYGKVMEAFVDRSILAEITLDDLRQEIYEIKNYVESGEWKPRPETNITEWEEERIEKLEEEIRDWEEENEQRIKEGKEPKLTKTKPQRSRAPIILLDEFEKCSREDVMNVIGKMTDREMNFSFMDKYFNFRLDLSQCQILLTANYLDRVPQFVKDRGMPINIELLTWEQRKNILRGRFKKEIRRFKLEHLQDRISEEFIEMCITETWGIRGGINNVAVVVRFLEVLEVDQKDAEKRGQEFRPLDHLEKLEKYDDLYETPREDYLKRETGIIKLSYELGGKVRTLTLTKRIGIEEREIKEVGKVKEIITGKNVETDKPFVEDWPDEYWWGSEPVREL